MSDSDSYILYTIMFVGYTILTGVVVYNMSDATWSEQMVCVAVFVVIVWALIKCFYVIALHTMGWEDLHFVSWTSVNIDKRLFDNEHLGSVHRRVHHRLAANHPSRVFWIDLKHSRVFAVAKPEEELNILLGRGYQIHDHLFFWNYCSYCQIGGHMVHISHPIINKPLR